MVGFSFGEEDKEQSVFEELENPNGWNVEREVVGRRRVS